MKIKRFATLIIALALLTTGGVFATWSYAGSDAGYAISKDMNFAMENSSVSMSNGTYYVTVSEGSSVFTIDQKGQDASNPDYTAELKVNPNATITVKFVPNVGANTDVKERGILSEVFFDFAKGSERQTYNMDNNGNYTTVENAPYKVEIISLKKDKITINPISDAPVEGQNYWTKTADGFTFTLDADDIKEYVSLNNADTKDGAGFYLDTMDEYLAFSGCLGKGYTVALVVQDPRRTAAG